MSLELLLGEDECNFGQEGEEMQVKLILVKFFNMSKGMERRMMTCNAVV